jgi:tripartite-type tricarboxylate transporter receptor subunit TctC
MRLSNREVGRWCRWLVGSCLLGAWSMVVQAQGAAGGPFPQKPIRIVVPFGAGGVADLTARTVSRRLAETLGQAVVVDNRPGAGGVVAADLVAKAEPDGHTLLLISNGTAVSAGLMKSLPYDPLKDFVSLGLIATFDIALIVPVDSRFASLGQLVQWARANPGRLNIGSINLGSTQHLTAEWFKLIAGIQAQVVPFNGTPAVLTALRGGQVDVAVEILGPVLPQLRGKAMRALAVTSERRSSALPDVPTAQEAGLKGLLASSWNGLAAPARTPTTVVERLNRELVSALQLPSVRQQLQDLNVDPHPGTPAQAHEWLQNEIRSWSQVIERAGIARQ